MTISSSDLMPLHEHRLGMPVASMHSDFAAACHDTKGNAKSTRHAVSKHEDFSASGFRFGGLTSVLLGVVAAQVDLLLGVPDVRLPAPGAPAQDMCPASCRRMQC